MVYTGTDRQHDKMEREAQDERAYNEFEKWYYFQQRRPKDIDEITWELIWGNLQIMRDNYYEISKIARNLSSKLSTTLILSRSPSHNMFVLEFEMPLHELYAFQKEAQSIIIIRSKLDGCYPNLELIANEQNHRDKASISRAARDDIRGQEFDYKSVLKFQRSRAFSYIVRKALPSRFFDFSENGVE
ncbi:hypothetical protein AB4205_07145 [Vibrio sp. 10N.286.49.F3]|uniref:hypothetical protein n=2 Tax=unclassified Vibrio TaxID=2614977 RepID=UPI00354E3722